MDYAELVAAHVARKADITIAAQPVDAHDAPGMGIFRFESPGDNGQIAAFEEKPTPERLAQIGPPPYTASMGIYVFSRRVLLEALAADTATDFGREIIPGSLGRRHVSAYMFNGYWADVGTIESFYDANIMLTQPGAPFKFYDPHRPIYTHPRFLPGSRFSDCAVRDAIVAEGCYLERCTIEQSVVGIRTTVQSGARITRSVLLGADYFEDGAGAAGTRRPPLGIGRDVVLDRVIVDKNARIGDGARLVNERRIDEADGDGYFIRNGVVIVPKDGSIAPGTTV
jgi:glucose-1-phosphate adenylyltransferase